MKKPFLVVFLSMLAAPAALAQDPNLCDEPGEAPDVIVGSLNQIDKWGTVGNISAWSLGTVSCNVGTCWLNWIDGITGSNQHPVIAQHLYRLRDGRFEQLGQSWLKHGFSALNGGLCGSCTQADGQHLGVNCSDPYNAFLNGIQNGMGPKFEVNPVTGSHPHPVTDAGATGNAIFKRLQLRHEDIDPALNPGAVYFSEAQYVTEDDSAAKNQNNNASYRPVVFNGTDPDFSMSFDGPTVTEVPAIHAWLAADPQVDLQNVDVTDDGRFVVGSRVTALGGGLWHYEYAVHNLNSHRGARSFSVPVPTTATLTNIGFHDVDYHSGEPIDGTDWPDNGGAGGALTWSTTADPQANSIRWGTLFNFRFDADVPPDTNGVTIGLWRAGDPADITFETGAPSVCNANGTCDPGEDCAGCPVDCADDVCDPDETVCTCAADCGAPPATELSCTNGVSEDCDGLIDCSDADCCADPACALPDGDLDTFVGCGDCDDTNGQIWAVPGEVGSLVLGHDAGSNVTTLGWAAPLDPGSTSVDYEVLRARDPDNFVTSTACLEPLAPGVPQAVDAIDPLPNLMFVFLVRATNDCAGGVGPLGSDSQNDPREGRSCD